MKLNLRRLALVLVAVPVLTIGISGCSMIGKKNQTADASADPAAAASQQGQDGGKSGMFGLLQGGC